MKKKQQQPWFLCYRLSTTDQSQHRSGCEWWIVSFIKLQKRSDTAPLNPRVFLKLLDHPTKHIWGIWGSILAAQVRSSLSLDITKKKRMQTQSLWWISLKRDVVWSFIIHEIQSLLCFSYLWWDCHAVQRGLSLSLSLWLSPQKRWHFLSRRTRWIVTQSWDLRSPPWKHFQSVSSVSHGLTLTNQINEPCDAVGKC